MNSPLPLASSAFPAQTAQTSNLPAIAPRPDAGWVREMERAQLASWFQPPAETPPHAPADSSRETAERRRGKQMSESAPGIEGRSAPRLPASSEAAAIVRALPSERHPASNVRSAYGLSLQSSSPLRQQSASSDSSPELTSSVSPSILVGGRLMQPTLQLRAQETGATGEAVQSIDAPAAELPSVRLHLEPGTRGQVVWIGVNADAQTLLELVPRIVSDLQNELRARGEKLQQVVCNGRVVWTDERTIGDDAERQDLPTTQPEEA